MKSEPSNTHASYDFEISTSSVVVRVSDTRYGEETILFLHGNSFGRSVFTKQFDSFLKKHYRLVSIDLPGHGDTTDLAKGNYSLTQMTKVILEVVEKMKLRRLVIVGWSLGGHIGLEVAAISKNVSALVLCGMAPMHRGSLSVMRAYRLSLDLLLASRAALNSRQQRRFTDVCFPGKYPETFLSYVGRTDLNARKQLTKSVIKAEIIDQRKFIEDTSLPVCIVNGDEEPFLRLSYLDKLKISDLYKGKALRISGAGHAPFWDRPSEFNDILDNFVSSTRDSNKAAARSS
jgi:pimeloyl-ACP methyl ester carboxylesterase